MPKLSRSAQPPHTAPEDIRVGHNTALAGILLMAYREAVMQAQRR
jgi:hypothetical protein